MSETVWVAPPIRAALPADLSELRRVYRSASLSNASDASHLLAHPEHLIFTGDGIADGLVTTPLGSGTRMHRELAEDDA